MGAVTEFFSSFWEGVKAVAVPVIEFYKSLFAWTPAGLIVNNWGIITPIFAAIFGRIQENVASTFAVIKEVFGWTPQGLIVNNWGPVAGLFAAIWDLLSALVVPLKEALRSIFNDYVPMDRINELWGMVPAFFAEKTESIRAVMMALGAIFGLPFMGSPLEMFDLKWSPLTDRIVSLRTRSRRTWRRSGNARWQFRRLSQDYRQDRRAV